MRIAAATNSKMCYLNIATKGLNGRAQPALLGATTIQDVSKMRTHTKMLCNDLYAHKMKAEYPGGSPHCRLCYDTSKDMKFEEDIEHILTICLAYSDVRSRILIEMKNVCENSKSGINIDELKQNARLLTQFILDCCSLNLPRRFNINDPDCQKIFQLSRDLCFFIRKTRTEKLKLLSE